MNKKILIHGATNCESSNYGDFIYTELIFDYVTSKGFDVFIWQPSQFIVEWLDHYQDDSNKRKKECKALIYIPGGYFGEGHNARFRDNIVQFLRFMPIGLWFSHRKEKKHCVIGIGAGPNNNYLLKKSIKRICDSSDCISVRDNTSYVSLSSICPKASIHNHFDLIVASKTVLKKDVIGKKNAIELNKRGNKKILLVHYNNNVKALHLFAHSVLKFIEKHDDYYPIVTSDNVLRNEEALFNEFKSIINIDCGHFIYQNPHELTGLLSEVDFVLTSKLHVGVVACTFNKSVIVAASHPEKTSRFYNQIGKGDRCVSLFEVNENNLVDLMDKYYKSSIHIDGECIRLADKSWELLDNFLSKV